MRRQPASIRPRSGANTAAGATAIQLAAVAGFNPVIAIGDILRVGVVADDEELVVVAGPAAGTTVTLRASLRLAHANGAQVHRQKIGAVIAPPRAIAPGTPAAPDSTVVLVDNNGRPHDRRTMAFDLPTQIRTVWSSADRRVDTASARPGRRICDYPADADRADNAWCAARPP